MKSRLAGRRWRKRSGQVILVAVVVFPALLAVVGLALDGGLVYQSKRRMQSAADAAALAGTWELWRRNPALVTTAARDDARLNGLNDGVNASVTVNNPPTSGAWAGNPGFVEVIITRDVPSTLLRVVGRQTSTVRARAVAGNQRHMDFCLLALHPTLSGSLIVAGNSTLTANCGVMVNSTAADALELGGGACINGTAVGVTGGWEALGSIRCINPEPESGVPPALDPLAYLVPPPIPSTVMADRFNKTGGSATVEPGLYTNGFRANGGLLNFNPGIYIIDGDFTLGGGTVARCEGCMFYFTNLGGAWGRVQIDGSALIDFTAPSSGPYEGVLMWMDRDAPRRPPGSFISGVPGSKFEGALYFPSVHLSLGGTNNTAEWTMAIADTADIQGDAGFPGSTSVTRVRPPSFKPMLVE